MPQVLLFLATVPYFFEFLNVYFLIFFKEKNQVYSRVRHSQNTARSHKASAGRR